MLRSARDKPERILSNQTEGSTGCKRSIGSGFSISCEGNNGPPSGTALPVTPVVGAAAVEDAVVVVECLEGKEGPPYCTALDFDEEVKFNPQLAGKTDRRCCSLGRCVSDDSSLPPPPLLLRPPGEWAAKSWPKMDCPIRLPPDLRGGAGILKMAVAVVVEDPRTLAGRVRALSWIACCCCCWSCCFCLIRCAAAAPAMV